VTTTGPPTTFTLTNTASVPLDVVFILLQGTIGEPFTIDASDCPTPEGTLAAGDSCEVQVAFTPSIGGHAEDALIAETGAGGFVHDLDGVAVGPDTTFTSFKVNHQRRSARFTLASPMSATFECKLDGATTFSPCPARLTKLKRGRHTLVARALLAGAGDPTPAVRTFRVRRSS
jgi:hypothetical protein